jgi:hypothetical protein
MGRLEGRTDRSGRESLGLFRLERLAGLLTKVWMDLMNHNPDITIATNDIELIRNAGNQLEAELMKLHRHHHGPDCETCQALITWWTINNR